MHENAKTLEALKEKKALSFAKKGIIFALVSGMIWALDGLTLNEGLSIAPFNDPRFWLIAPLFSAGIHDLFMALFTFLYNCSRGMGREVGRTLLSKPGIFCALGAVFGAPLGMGGYLLALSFASPAYVLPITSMYPAVAAVLAVFLLGEKITKRAGIGLLLCITGAAVISYVPSDGSLGDHFLLGIIFALICAVGWASEGVIETSAMDFVDPTVALNVCKLCSAFLYFAFIIPAACWYGSSAENLPAGEFLAAALNGKALWIVAFAGVIGGLSYICYYTALNMAGVSRAMALNITYSLWGVVFSALFFGVDLTATLVGGACIIFIGMFFVIGNPKDMLTLRSAE
ncbi:MAG: DMT family transporter [Mailhella sp.]|nr:DMT family transporter [Mailhella sp.]